MTSLADIIVSDDTETSGANSDASATATTQTDTSDNQAADDGLPEKFRGKTASQIVEMYQHLESEKGRLANELGTQRVLTDRILQLDQKRTNDLRTNTPSAAASPKVTTDDILNRPQEVLENVTDARARAAVEPVNERITQLEAALARTRFEARHSDFQDVVNDPAFMTWIQASPLRSRAAVAANSGNWDVASDLLTDFKREKAATAATRSNTSTANPNLEAARRATLESGTSAGSNDSGGGKPVGKIFKRTELMKMRATDPEGYYDDAFQAEVLKAYAEDRVR